MTIRHRVTLTVDERHQLDTIVGGGSAPVRQVKRAQILLATAAESSTGEIARHIRVGVSTVYRTKQRFLKAGLQRALHDAPRVGAPRKLDSSDESLLIAVACSDPPMGQAAWTVDLLADAMVQLTAHKTLSGDTVGRRLAELALKPWQKKMWCVATLTAEYVARMEDVLTLYAEAPDPRRPVVCFDETSRQLVGEARVPIRAEPGKPRRRDYEYVRNGTANVFMFVDVNRPWRHAKVTDRRTCIDFAECMRDLVDTHYPAVDQIRVVLDNLSTHSAAALHQAFAPAEARRILSRLEFHFTPKHASWLNMVEIEIGVMVGQCLNRRIPDKPTLIKELAAWERRRNAQQARIEWLFTVERAREKLGHRYPQPVPTPPRPPHEPVRTCAARY
jgi:transposase